MRKTLAVYACLLCFIPIFFGVLKVEAQGVDAAVDDMEARFQAMEERIHALEEEVELLHAVLAATPVSTPAVSASAAQPASPAASPGNLQAPSAPLPVYGGAASQTKILNPDIGVIGNFTGASGHNRIDTSPALSLAETEISLQALIDPYARADFFIALGEEGVEVEEGYITFPALPGGFLLKAGRMRAGFGKVNALHNHSLPWIDRPLVAFNLLGGDPEEADVGIKDAGFSVSRILPLPGETFWEVTAEMYRGDSGTLFQANRRSDLGGGDCRGPAGFLLSDCAFRRSYAVRRDHWPAAGDWLEHGDAGFRARRLSFLKAGSADRGYDGLHVWGCAGADGGCAGVVLAEGIGMLRKSFPGRRQKHPLQPVHRVLAGTAGNRLAAPQAGSSTARPTRTPRRR